jgi:uncharacterized protein (DUF58 family)
MLLPQRRLGVLCGVGAGLWLGAALFPPLAWVVAALDAVLVALFVVDLVAVGRAGPFRCRRAMEPVLSHDARNLVTVTVANRGRSVARVRVVETWPETFAPRRIELPATVAPGEEVALPYRVVPAARGRFTVAAAPLRVVGPLGLAAREVAALPAAEAQVYPSVAGVGKFQLLARRALLAEHGVRRLRPAGGTEIEGLREYSPGDDYRAVDWKATARRQRPISRELRPARSQQVILCFDAGRHMTEDLGGGTRFDRAVDAALVLAHVATLQGDRVGLLAFGDKVVRYLQPLRGPGATPALARALFDLKPTLVEPDYGGAFRYLAAHDRRRALLVLFTEVVSAEASDALCAHLVHAARRHVPLAVCLRDERLREQAAAAPRDARGAYERAAALDLVGERAQALRALERGGVQVVEAGADGLQAALVSRYLSLKTRLVI